MFTGIIQAVGCIAEHETRGGDIRLAIDCGDLDLAAIGLGDSVAVNGVCLTAIDIRPPIFAADVSLETAGKTSLAQLAVGSPVNLETALTLQTALGGHLVSGHVDGIGRLIEIRAEARSLGYRFELEPALQHYIAAKGSVAVDGCSLTVNRVESNQFDVNIVPHTQQQTVMQFYQPGTQVNIEVDLIARYLERLLQGKADGNADNDQQLVETLVKSGFINHE